jgi:hypothetical protein
MGSRISKAARRSPPHEAGEARGTTAVASHDACEARQASSLPQMKPVSPFLPPVANVDVEATSTPSLLHRSEMDVEPQHHRSHMAPDTQSLERLPPGDSNLGSGLQSAAVPELPPAQADMEHSRPPVPHTEIWLPPPLPTPSILAQPDITCTICCERFARDQEQTSIAYPCQCEAAYCTSCLKNMFVKACKDVSRMPPRCCNQIQLHWARPYLTKQEAAEFRQKYEEWSTPNPLYCPVPTCSTFISNRLLKQKRDRRVDSLVGPPTAPNVSCPECDTDICTSCRQLAHADSVCAQLTFGVDKEMAALLKDWGYKRCPKCGQGVRRMYGCNHMECLCGAHWCWVCQRARDECDFECFDSDDEDYNSGVEDEGLDDPQPVESRNTDAAPTQGVPQEAATQTETERPRSPQRTQVRNLDAGSRGHWENSNYDFGDEPTEEVQDRAWDCVHHFETSKTSFADSLRIFPAATAEMECCRCWCIIHPEIQKPPQFDTSASGTLVRGSGRGRLRGGVRGRRNALRQHAPRWDHELVRRDATLGTRTSIASASASTFSQSTPDLDTMDDIVYSNNGDRVVDTYGNIISSTDFVLHPEPLRRFSFDFTAEPMLDLSKGIAVGTKPTYTRTHPANDKADAEKRAKVDAPPFSLAYVCKFCDALVCESCKKEMDVEAQARAETRDFY